MKTLKNLISISILALLLPVMGLAQSAEYTVDESSTMKITGTSTIHDWEAEVQEMDLTVALNPELMNTESPQSPVSSLAINVPVKSIESGKGGMNRRINDALNEKKNPEIMFNLISSELAEGEITENSFTLNLRGNLNIAGFTREITFPVTGTKVDANSYRFEGSYGLNMKDYEVDPPSAMLGAIKSGEEVEIVFNILLKANQSQAQNQ
jgi:polyisoprenoid-binding protein YceI